MWPKEDILFYELSQPLSKLLHLFIEKDCTRVPVCRGSLEHVLGVITSMDYFLHQDALLNGDDLIKYLEKPFFVPVTTSARVLLKRMDAANLILAFIVDEYGSITGLISREDLIEVVVGHIEDEKDLHPLFITSGESEVIASGKWELSEFNEYFHTQLTSKSHNVTLGGWLTEKVGDIPKSGMKTELDGFLFQVLAASPKRIIRLFIRKLPQGPV